MMFQKVKMKAIMLLFDILVPSQHLILYQRNILILVKILNKWILSERVVYQEHVLQCFQEHWHGLNAHWVNLCWMYMLRNTVIQKSQYLSLFVMKLFTEQLSYQNLLKTFFVQQMVDGLFLQQKCH